MLKKFIFLTVTYDIFKLRVSYATQKTSTLVGLNLNDNDIHCHVTINVEDSQHSHRQRMINGFSCYATLANICNRSFRFWSGVSGPRLLEWNSGFVILYWWTICIEFSIKLTSRGYSLPTVNSYTERWWLNVPDVQVQHKKAQAKHAPVYSVRK